MSETMIKCEPIDEAYNLLQNGIFVETSKGLVCMSLTDAISSDLNLSEEDLKNVATKLISQQNVKKHTLNFDSDGFSSECSASDVSVTSAPSLAPNYVTFTPSTIASGTNVVVTQQVQISDEIKIANIEVHKPPKRRGGWPKGRKRKPELKNLPPKAPATGYNLYLNEQRKLFKDSKLVFHEITKIIGNKWSNLSLDEKRPYLVKAEEDKRRYREELKQYRQSDAYRAYLAKKRKDRLQNNVLSESDMDATDEIDEEDNEELYCRTCDQWFHNLHNKREHLQGLQHAQSVAGDIKKELDLSASDSGILTSFDESSLDGHNFTDEKVMKISKVTSVADCMTKLAAAITRREKEIKTLQGRLEDTHLTYNAFLEQLNALKQRHNKLKNNLNRLKEDEKNMESKVAQLWQVPSWFIITEFNTEEKILMNDG